MKKIFLLLSLFTSIAFANSYNVPVETVSYVDPVQFVGRWYQIARNPMIFEPRNCVCAQQTLGLLDNGELSVYNSCIKKNPNGKLRDISGTAENVSKDGSNSKFKVDFGLPWKGDYWIIGLAEDYSWAVVSDPRRRSLYILSKTPIMTDSNYKAALSSASEQISINKLKITNHEGCTYPN